MHVSADDFLAFDTAQTERHVFVTGQVFVNLEEAENRTAPTH